MMYSPKWKLRQDGVKQFTDGMQKAIEESSNQGPIKDEGTTKNSNVISAEFKINQAIILNMNEVLKDKVNHIVSQAIPML